MQAGRGSNTHFLVQECIGDMAEKREQVNARHGLIIVC